MLGQNNNMNEEDEINHKQVAVTQGDIRTIKREVEIVSDKVNDLHQAIVGSPLSKDGGMVQRIKDCEINLDKIKEEIEEIEKNNIKSNLYLKIIWGMCGAIAAIIINYFLHK